MGETQAARTSKFARMVTMASAIALGAAGMVLTATPASAVTVASISDITTTLTGCTGTTASPTVITLTGNITATTTVVSVPCVVELDLAGYTLQVRSVSISAGQQLTIDDSGSGGILRAVSSAAQVPAIQTTDATLIVNGGEVIATTTGAVAAAIGGADAAGGTVIINDGKVTATATGNSAAGIGGARADGGTVIINGGEVTARGGISAAGIGGGGSGSGGSVTINGGTVTANGGGGIGGAGIGGGGIIGGSGGDITITGGTVTATGGGTALGGAGIGGGVNGTGGTITITGGEVTATAGGTATTAQGGAGIGGGANNTLPGVGTNDQGNGGTVTISGGTVVATGKAGGAGIGGGRRGDGGTVTINGGTVTAVGSSGTNGNAAGIGGGGGAGNSVAGREDMTSGGSVYIGEGADVTATGGYTAIGSGEPLANNSSPESIEFGSLEVRGTLYIPSGYLRIQDSNTTGAEVVIGETGKILGTTADPTTGATIAGTSFGGAGQIDNSGVIALIDPLVTADGVTVFGHHYEVSFDTHGGTPTAGSVVIFAPSFDTGYRDYPYTSDPTRGTDLFKGWNSEADGSGSTLSGTSTLPGLSTDGAAVAVTYHALWATDPEIISGLPNDEITISTTTGGTFTPTVVDSDGDPYPTDPSTWTITDAGGAVTATIDPVTGEVTVSSTQAGTYTLTLSVPTATGLITRDITVIVELTPFVTGPTADFTGVLSVGETLTASYGTTDPLPDSVEYIWFADGVQIGVGLHYVLTSAEVGKWISVQAIVTRAGYETATDTSIERGPVLAPETEVPSTPPPDTGTDSGTDTDSDSGTDSGTDPDTASGALPATGADAASAALTAGGAALIAALGVVLILHTRARRALASRI
ncbi:LPXTG cell wall anchor domain-containing protein [Microbacterium sp.]|uniref:LPXTG cell wall anchor domain-containing protein n=1 Tax=Microbacterium sp. TaxID=51671 RepID=UPI0039E5086F